MSPFSCRCPVGPPRQRNIHSDYDKANRQEPSCLGDRDAQRWTDWCERLPTRQLRRDAFDALAEAGRITILGYSLPRVDIVMSGMFGTVLRSEEVTVEVVDPKRDTVCKRILTFRACRWLAEGLLTTGGRLICIEHRAMNALGEADEVSRRKHRFALKALHSSSPLQQRTEPHLSRARSDL